MKKHWFIDCGHGFDTSGKRSKVWPDGTQLFEYEFNRAIGLGIGSVLDDLGIHFSYVNNDIKDMSLHGRVYIANNTPTQRPPVYLSIHGNGFYKESVNGFEVFTSNGETKSDKIAEILLNKLKTFFPDENHRYDTTDGDKDKEVNFYVLRNTKCPAILSENGFFTNKKQCRDMLSMEFRHKVIKAHVAMIIQVEKSSTI